MKKYYQFALFAVIIVSLGNAAGAGFIQNRDFTGSPVSSGTCAGCHQGGNFAPIPQIQLMENGLSVDKYVPGQTYQVNLTIDASNFPSGFGFQMIGLDANNAQVGIFGTLPTGTRFAKVNDRNYFEHSRRLSQNSFMIDWTAPDMGAGDITWYAVGNAVNANGNTFGDAVATTSLLVIEDNGVAVEETQLSRSISIYPVPAEDWITLTLEHADQNYTETQIFDLSGQLLLQSSDLRINVSMLNAGSYLAVLKFEDEIAVKRFLKL